MASRWVRLAQARPGAVSEDVSPGPALSSPVVACIVTCLPRAASSLKTTPMRRRYGHCSNRAGSHGCCGTLQICRFDAAAM